MYIMSIYMKNKICKTFSVKFFCVNYGAKAIEYQCSDRRKFMYYKNIDISYDGGFCFITVSK